MLYQEQNKTHTLIRQYFRRHSLPIFPLSPPLSLSLSIALSLSLSYLLSPHHLLSLSTLSLFPLLAPFLPSLPVSPSLPVYSLPIHSSSLPTLHHPSPPLFSLLSLSVPVGCYRRQSFHWNLIIKGNSIESFSTETAFLWRRKNILSSHNITMIGSNKSNQIVRWASHYKLDIDDPRGFSMKSWISLLFISNRLMVITFIRSYGFVRSEKRGIVCHKN